MTKPGATTFARSVIAFLVAHMILMRGRQISLQDLAREDFYLLSVLLCFAASTFIWICIARISRYFNIKYDWVEKPAERFVLQSLASVVAPILLMVTTTGSIVCLFHGPEILNLSFFLNQFVITIAFILLVNLFYFVRYLYHRMEQTRRILEREFPYFSNLRF